MIDPAQPDFTNTPASARRPRFEYAPAHLSPPQISIVTPFFNTGAVFEETATSIMRQSFQQWEWIIVNDGSDTSESLSILDRYRDLDPRIRIVDHPVNRGLSAARNTGFAQAQTPFVLQLDSDNLLEPTAAEKWAWYLDAHREHAFVKGFTVVFGAQQGLWSHGFHDQAAFLESNQVDATAMVRREVHALAGGYDERNRDGLEDWHFWLRCANAGFWGGTIPEYLEWYRRRTDHHERWRNWDDGDRQRRFHAQLKAEFPALWSGNFPEPAKRGRLPDRPEVDLSPFDNILRKTKKRLLLLVPWMAVGGADKFNLDLLRELTARDWEVTVATTQFGEDEWAPLFATLTSDVFAMHRFLRVEDYPRFLSYLIRSRGVDVVMIAHSELAYSLLPYLRSLFPHVAFSDSLHVIEPDWNEGGYPHLSILNRQHIDLSVAASEQVRSWMVERGADRERVAVCHINVDTEVVRPDVQIRADVRREKGVTESAVVILFAGRLCVQKQPFVLAHAIALLQPRVPNCEVWVAGDGPESDNLRSTLRFLGIQNTIRLLGAVPPSEVARLMAAADILFLPSKYEGIALVLFEAMAAGLPVVSADVGGQRELVTEDCGVLIAASDPGTEALYYADVLAELIADPARRAAMGRAGRARAVSHFDLNQMGKRMSSLLDHAAELCRMEPRPLPSREVALASAAAAVERWHRSHAVVPMIPTVQRKQSLGFSTHRLLNRWLSPLFHWGVGRGWSWLPRAGKWIRELLRGPDEGG